MDQVRMMDHARNPRNWGEMDDANGIMINTQPCGDIVMFFVKVENDCLVKVQFLVQGCHNLIACCSILTVLARRKSIWEAIQITPGDVEKAIGGLPPEELHAAEYAIDALYGAIQDYLLRHGGQCGAGKKVMGEGWRALYVQAQKGAQPLTNLYRGKKK